MKLFLCLKVDEGVGLFCVQKYKKAVHLTELRYSVLTFDVERLVPEPIQSNGRVDN
jgi:hypothetical protein